MENDSTHDDAQGQAIPPDLPRPSGRAILLVVLVFLGLLAALFVIGYVPYRNEVEAARVDAADQVAQVPSVGVMTPRETLSSKEVVIPADVHPDQETAIFPRTTGYVRKIYVDINDKVRAGQLLAEIETPEVDAQLVQSIAALAQAKANVVKAQSDVTLASKTLDRYKQLSPGAASEQDLDQRQGAYDAAVAALEQTKAAVGVADADVQRLTVLQGFEKVTAPFAGTITARNYDPGALLSPTNISEKEMFRVVQCETMRVDVNLPQALASEVAIGEKAYLTVRNYPSRQFEGVVARTSSALSTSSRTMLFELNFKNPDGLLYPGMYGQVRLMVSKQQSVLVIPTAAMIFSSAGTQVATVRENHVHFQDIQVGRDFGTEMEVLSGLSKETQVVANPAAQISEGMRVQPLPQRVAQAPVAAPSGSR